MVNCVDRMRWRLILCLFLGATTATGASAIDLLANGNFEATPISGRPPGWSLFEQTGSTGRFYLDTPGSTIPSGEPGLQSLGTPINTLTPGGGNQYAISVPTSDATADVGPAAHALYQSFSLPGPATTVRLSFQLFSRDFFNTGLQVSPAGLDYTTADINQHTRVDLLRGGASPLSTASQDVVSNFYLNLGTSDSEWTQYNRDITSLIVPGQTYTLRFATVSNTQVIALGVDNVQISYDPAVAPEMGTTHLFVPPALFLLLKVIKRRRDKRTINTAV